MDVSTIKIYDLTTAEAFLDLLWDRNIPVIGACACLGVDNKSLLRPICENEHLILVPKRHSEIALELLRSIEEDFPILY